MESARTAALGVCSWSLRPRDPAALAAEVRAAGLDAVQLALVPMLEDPRHWSGGVETLRGAGIRILSGMMATLGEDYSTLESIARTGGLRPRATWEANLDRALRLADIAAGAGIRLVTLHAGFIPHAAADPERPELLDRLRTVVEVFARRGVDVGLETGQERAETLAEVLTELSLPTLGVNFDPANVILYGMGDPIAAMERLAPWIRQVHVKDALPSASPGTWGREVPAGGGAVDWTAFAGVLHRLPRRVDLVIEREAGDSRVTDVAAARALAAPMLR